MSKNTPHHANATPTRKRVVLYARVSTQEQTRGKYPSCQSQIEELTGFCAANGWEIFDSVKDEGVSAGSLHRQGLSQVRWLVETEQIDAVVCTWYDRMTRSRDFYVLDKEFKAHNVEFLTLHDPTDRNTASGRFLETMLVAAKTYEREQTAEKVRTKMRMRTEKGLWNGGLVPFGFRRDPQTQAILVDEALKPTLQRMFEIYVEERTDFAVRDWLKAHGIPAHSGRSEWNVSSIRDLLKNRRYIAEIEINAKNKGIVDLPESEAYQVVPAPHEPLVSRELFEMALAIRQERALQSPNRGGKGYGQGKGKGNTKNQCHRIYPLQGIMVCGDCECSMTPHYVYHKPNPQAGRQNASFIYHYVCTQRVRYRNIDHTNRILARVPEAWIIDQISQLVKLDGVLARALEIGWAKTDDSLQPAKDALALCNRSLEENQRKIEELVAAALQTDGALMELLKEKAGEVKAERERLHAEQRQLSEAIAPLSQRVDASEIQDVLSDFLQLAEAAQPQEVRRLMRLIVRRIVWRRSGEHTVQYWLPTRDTLPRTTRNMLVRNSSAAGRIPNTKLVGESQRVLLFFILLHLAGCFQMAHW